MKVNTDIFKKFSVQIWYFITIPLFFLLFILLYSPFDSREFLSSGRDLFAFNATILTAILLVFMVCSRLAFHLIWRKRTVSMVGYSFWCVGEAVAAAFFLALYLYLMNKGNMPYFSVLGKCIVLSVLVSVFPYLIITLLMLLRSSPDVPVQEALPVTSEGSSIIRFTDSTQRLKLAIAASAVVYIEAEENYVRVHYLENGHLKEYALRNSMKTVEELVSRSGLIRSHRSYIVNPSHIKLVRKDKEGAIVADFDVEAPSVPVSKKYYDCLVNLLG